MEQVPDGDAGQGALLPKDEWDFTFANIDYVEPLDEPDADYESYKEFI